MLIRRRGSAQSPRDVGNRQDLNQSSSVSGPANFTTGIDLSPANFTRGIDLFSPALNIVAQTFSASIPLPTSDTPSDTTTTLTAGLPLSSIVSAAATVVQSSPTAVPSSLFSSSLSSSSVPSSSVPSSAPSSVPTSLLLSFSSRLPSSRNSSLSSTISAPATTTHSSSIDASPSSLSGSPSAPDFDSFPSDVTSFITSTSGNVPTTVVTVVAASATSSPSQPSSPPSSFLQNKAQSGAVFGLIALAILAGIGFLASRLFKLVKKRKTDRETEDAAREAAMVKVRLDDIDDGRYGGPANPFSMMEYPNKLALDVDGFDMHTKGSLGMQDFDDRRSASGVNPFFDNGMHNVPLHHQPNQHPPPYNSAHDAFDLAERGHSSLSPRTSISSREVAAGSYAPTETLSKQQSQGSINVAWSGRSNANVVSAPESHTQPPPVPLPVPPPVPPQESLPATLPEAFGEGEAARSHPRFTAKSLKDYEDYQGTIARVLKIANE